MSFVILMEAINIGTAKGYRNNGSKIFLKFKPKDKAPNKAPKKPNPIELKRMTINKKKNWPSYLLILQVKNS